MTPPPLGVFALGIALDLLIGDPRWLPHPIRWLGALIVRLEKLWRASRLPLRLAGCGLWLSTVPIAAGVVDLTPWLAVYWIFALIAIRNLDQEAAAVIGVLPDLDEARLRVAGIVGRDTAHLSESEIIRATIETVAENFSDAVVAPLFYLALGGPVAMAAYKAVNTLDSMVGYKDERYRELGWASARIDDVANFLPSRLSVLLIWIASVLLLYDIRRSVRVTLRDARSQPSPNSGYPEAAFAGALGIRLGGVNYYRGVESRKAFLGDPVRPIDRAAFARTRRLYYVSTAILVIAIGLLLPWSYR
jgi:adenosylcobinamide-phosphate synthase